MKRGYISLNVIFFIITTLFLIQTTFAWNSKSYSNDDNSITAGQFGLTLSYKHNEVASDGGGDMSLENAVPFMINGDTGTLSANEVIVEDTGAVSDFIAIVTHELLWLENGSSICIKSEPSLGTSLYYALVITAQETEDTERADADSFGNYLLGYLASTQPIVAEAYADDNTTVVVISNVAINYTTVQVVDGVVQAGEPAPEDGSALNSIVPNAQETIEPDEDESDSDTSDEDTPDEDAPDEDEPDEDTPDEDVPSEDTSDEDNKTADGAA